MTDESGANESQEPSASEELQEAVKGVAAQLTFGEQLIAGASLLVLVVCWLVGALLLDDYSMGLISFLIPIGLLATMYLYYSGKQSVWDPFYGTIVRVGSWAMAIIGVHALINNTLISSARPKGATVLYELVFYAAAVMFAIGAWQLRDDER